MSVERKSRILAAVAIALCLLPAASGPPVLGAASPAERVSALGRYQGHSAAVFDAWTRASQYVTVRDGRRIAIDIFRPTKHLTAGHRLRIAITCADKDSYQHVGQDSPAQIAVLRDEMHRSRVTLRVMVTP